MYLLFVKYMYTELYEITIHRIKIRTPFLKEYEFLNLIVFEFFSILSVLRAI